MVDAHRALEDLLADLKKDGVRVVVKDGFWTELAHWMVMLVTFGAQRRFREYYTTVGPVIGVPVGWDIRSAASRYAVLIHERRHVCQFRKAGLGSAWLGILPTAIAYLLLPLPLGLAWCRWRLERTAYVEGIKARMLWQPEARERLIDHAVYQLTSGAYGWTAWIWPGEKRVRRWFERAVKPVAVAGHLRSVP